MSLQSAYRFRAFHRLFIANPGLFFYLFVRDT
jgi:hypothetical protein